MPSYLFLFHTSSSCVCNCTECFFKRIQMFKSSFRFCLCVLQKRHKVKCNGQKATQPAKNEMRNEYTSNKWIGDANSNSTHKWIDAEHCSSFVATWCFVHDTLFFVVSEVFVVAVVVKHQLQASQKLPCEWMQIKSECIIVQTVWIPYFNRWVRISVAFLCL